MTILAFGELLKPYDLLIKYKHVMGENILHISSHICYISAKRCKIILAILFFDTCKVTYMNLEHTWRIFGKELWKCSLLLAMKSLKYHLIFC